jgi:single-strand DNA-binding protein
MARSLNKVTLIGNLTRDPELRYTPQGTAVCSFGIATNRQWSTDTGEKKEDVEFHNVVAWNKLAEICAQILSKGRKVYVEGRLQTNTWTGDDDVKRSRTEVVINEMIALDSKGAFDDSAGDDFDVPDSDFDSVPEEENQGKKKDSNKDKKEEESEEDIPF